MAFKMQIKTSSASNEKVTGINDMLSILTFTKFFSVRCDGRFWIVVRSKPFSVLGEATDLRLPCCIWGNLADNLHSACNQEDGMVRVLLRFAKFERIRVLSQSISTRSYSDTSNHFNLID
ncbi:hypothetical protein YC2023_117055 [Brassica napus]